MTFTVRPLPCNYCASSSSAWDELNQPVIVTAVKQWRTRLHACVKAKGGYFGHSRPKLTLINMHTLRFCAFETLLCCKLPFVSMKCPTCVSLHKAT